MSKTRVAVIFGGKSNEHEVSLVSAANIIRNIPKDKYDVACVGITKKGRWLLFGGKPEAIEDGSWEKDPDNVECILSPDPIHKGFLAILDDGTVQRVKIDVVFPVLHGKNGEDGTIQGLFTLAEMPFVGCDLISSANCMDKDVTHLILEANGIKTAKWLTLRESQIDTLPDFAKKADSELKYPLFVKPANCGSSVGISKVSNIDELKSAIKLAFTHDKKVLVEQGIVGIECECAVMGNDKPFSSDVGEISAANDFYDYDAKYKNAASETYIPAKNIPENKRKEISEIALSAYKALGCEGLARVDFFYCDNGEIFLNEINTLPGHTSISMYPKLMENYGLTPAEQADRLIALALNK